MERTLLDQLLTLGLHALDGLGIGVGSGRPMRSLRLIHLRMALLCIVKHSFGLLNAWQITIIIIITLLKRLRC